MKVADFHSAGWTDFAVPCGKGCSFVRHEVLRRKRYADLVHS